MCMDWSRIQGNDLGNSSFSVSDEILNVVSKTALLIAFSLHIGGHETTSG